MSELLAKRQEFIDLMKKIFHFEEEDLDFGLYRIMNQKRKQVQKFLERDLIDIISQEIRQISKKNRKTREISLESVKNRNIMQVAATEDVGDARGDPDLNADMWENSDETRQCLVQRDIYEEMERTTYNHLLTFFSRYHDDGDFLTQRRYGKKARYMVPHDGEEIHFYWASHDQYYVKTSEDFNTYKFVIDDRFLVVFRIVHAEIEKGNVKAPEKKFFVLSNPPFSLKEDQLEIFFEHRSLTDVDFQVLGLSKHGKKIQEKIRWFIHDFLKGALELETHSSLRKLFSEDERGRTLLATHLQRYFKKNLSDYFIHKDLKGFLLRELDLYLKNEVLDLDQALERMPLDEASLRTQLTVARLVKTIATRIIEFVHQVEEFQKKLWEKKKFVIETHYVITLDRIQSLAGEEFLMEHVDEILANQVQLDEWKDLTGQVITARTQLFSEDPLTGRKWRSLPLDTRYFGSDFKWRLLSAMARNDAAASLESSLDGVLIKSENWQALNLILSKYRDRVKLIYIDPPFNKEQEADYLYKVGYKDATWITMLENRLSLSKHLLHSKGSIFVRCDYNGNMYMRLLLDRIFGRECFRNEIIVRRGSPKAGLFSQFDGIKSIGVTYDNLYWYSRHPDARYPGFVKQLSRKKEGYWSSFKKIYDRPTMRYELLGVSLEKGQWMWKEERARRAVENYQKYLKEAKNTGESLEEYSRRTGIKDFIRRKGDAIQYWVSPKEKVMLDNNWLDIPGYSSTWGFKTENSEKLLKRIIEAITTPGELVLDFFLGSGTTTAVAHKLRRKWIGIEMGEHFWTVILPRMKKVLFHDKSGISREKSMKNRHDFNDAGGFFKYHVLEQFEDSFENVEFQDRQQVVLEKLEGYIMKYMFHVESKDSQAFLNVMNVQDPFNYQLKVIENHEVHLKLVDLVETFNYLLGVHVESMKREVIKGKVYVIVSGHDGDGQKICIIWRNWENLDHETDKQVIDRLVAEMKPDLLYVNGESTVRGAKPIEPTFKKLMFNA